MTGLFAYRLPGATDMVAFKSDSVENGLIAGSFVAAPFDCADPERCAVSIIPGQKITVADINALLSDYMKPQEPGETKENQSSANDDEYYFAMVRAMIEDIREGRLKKCVASRRISQMGRLDVGATFTNLCSAYPNAFAFLFFTERTGLWMGASPELLLKKKGKEYLSMALAGTKKSDSEQEWGNKEIEEQAIVSDYICRVFTRFHLNPKPGPRSAAEAGPVRHLRTMIEGHADEQEVALAELLAELDPTPALAGEPKDMALKAIERYEDFDREYYGGYCGVLSAEGDAELYVNLRSMKVEPNGCTLYVGGGITLDSVPEDEYCETRAKAATLCNHLAFHDR